MLIFLLSSSHDGCLSACSRGTGAHAWPQYWPHIPQQCLTHHQGASSHRRLDAPGGQESCHCNRQQGCWLIAAPAVNAHLRSCPPAQDVFRDTFLLLLLLTGASLPYWLEVSNHGPIRQRVRLTSCWPDGARTHGATAAAVCSAHNSSMICRPYDVAQHPT